MHVGEANKSMEGQVGVMLKRLLETLVRRVEDMVAKCDLIASMQLTAVEGRARFKMALFVLTVGWSEGGS